MGDRWRRQAKYLSGFELDDSGFEVDVGGAHAGDAIAGMQIALNVRSQFFGELDGELFLLDFENQGLRLLGFAAQKIDQDAFKVEEARGDLLGV